jgi:hypothetical protein
MIVGCYDMHLYCDGEGCKTWSKYVEAFLDQVAEGEYSGRTAADCIRQAKKHGWRFNMRGQCKCKRCVGVGNKYKVMT